MAQEPPDDDSRPSPSSPLVRSTPQASPPSLGALLALVLAPLLWVLNRLTLAWKLVVVGILMLVPTSYAGWRLYRDHTLLLDFNRAEVMGTHVVRPYIPLAAEHARHWVLALGAAKGVVDPKEVAASAAKIDQLIAEVDRADAKYSAPMAALAVNSKVSERWKINKAKWETAREAARGSDLSKIETTHIDLTGSDYDVILNGISNQSNLILDPDLDSYWLMDIDVDNAPLLIAGVTKLASRAIVGGGTQTDRLFELAGLHGINAVLMADTEHISLKTAIDNSPAFSGRDLTALMTPLIKLKDDQTAHNELVKRAYISAGGVHDGDVRANRPASLGESPVQVDRTTDSIMSTLRVIDSAAALWNAIDVELRTMCQIRVDTYTAKRQRTASVIAIFAIASAIYLLAGLYVAIRRRTPAR